MRLTNITGGKRFLIILLLLVVVVVASRSLLRDFFGRTSNRIVLDNKTSRNNGLVASSTDSSSLQGDCHTLCNSLTIEKVIEKSDQCSKNVSIQSVQCSCESLMLCKFLVVSAISDNHFKEAEDFIASVQTHMPTSPIIVYNLGLSKESKERLSKFCNVRVREFNFNKYPKHFRNLRFCAWKPLLINELYEELHGRIVMWADASCRVLHPVTPLFSRFSKFPLIPGTSDGHYFIATTHDGMLKYLKLNKTRKEYATIGRSLQANVVFYWFNDALQERFLKFWVDCALHEECVSPKGAKLLGCDWKDMEIGGYACHRYDQAAYNAILTREFGFEFMKEMAKNSADNYFIIERFPTERYKLLEGNCVSETVAI